ncbi:MAG TPA: response regulator, partial [Polyangia bacterium]
MHILIVEDDPRLVRMLDRGLTEEGYSVSAVGDGNRGLAALGSGGFDACILDVRLPGLDGFEILERARAQGVATPVILLTARDAVPDRVHGLRIGADDYLTKPFAFAELVARLQARTRGRGAAERCLRCGPIELDTAEHRVTVAGQRVELSAR